MDYPRFEHLQQRPSDTLHLAYHGGAVVELIFRLVDYWLTKSPRVVWWQRFGAPRLQDLSKRQVLRSLKLHLSQPEASSKAG